MVSIKFIFYAKIIYVVYKYINMSIDCSRKALNSSLWQKITDNGDKNVTIGYFNDNFINKWGDVEGTSIHSSGKINGSIYTIINNEDLANNLGTLEIEWAIRSDGSAKVEIIDENKSVRDKDAIQSESNELVMIKKKSILSYKNGDIIKISETGGAGLIFLKSIKFINSSTSKLKNIDDLTPIVEDISQDIEFINKINTQLKKWTSNGIEIPDTAFIQISKQKENAKLKINDIKNNLIQEIISVNRADKDLKSHKNIEINNKSYTQTEIVSLYHQAIKYLKNSIIEIKKIKENLANFEIFGADIGNSIQSINNQIDNLNEHITNSEIKINDIFEDANNFAKLIDEIRN